MKGDPHHPISVAPAQAGAQRLSSVTFVKVQREGSNRFLRSQRAAGSVRLSIYRQRSPACIALTRGLCRDRLRQHRR